MKSNRGTDGVRVRNGSVRGAEAGLACAAAWDRGGVVTSRGGRACRPDGFLGLRQRSLGVADPPGQ